MAGSPMTNNLFWLFRAYYDKIFYLVVDILSKWPETLIISNSTNKHTITCLSSLFDRYGYPITLASYIYGINIFITSEEFKIFLRNYGGVRHVLSVQYPRDINSQAERYVQIFQRALKALASESGILQRKLNTFLLQYRQMPHITTENNHLSLFLKRHGKKIDLIVPNIQNVVKDK